MKPGWCSIDGCLMRSGYKDRLRAITTAKLKFLKRLMVLLAAIMLWHVVVLSTMFIWL